MNKKELIKDIKNANHSYTTGFPYLTDAEYDKLWSQLFKIDPTNPVLFHTTTDPMIPFDCSSHSHPIKGTQKAFNMTDLKPFITRFSHETLIMEPKYDGCAAVIYKQPGGKNKIILEGNGYHGRDITHHIENFSSYPTDFAFNSVEIIIPNRCWNDSMGKNQRNTVAGWIHRTNFPAGSKYKSKLISHNHGHLSHVFDFTGNYDELELLLMQKYAKWSVHYPLDGIMIKVHDEKTRIQVGDNGTYYHWSIAWKPPIQTAETLVTDIEWNVSRTGRVIPTVIYEPIELCGTTNKRATGNNYQWMVDKNIGINTILIVGKAGEIIPKILSASNNSFFSIPMFCPICSEDLIIKGKDLICNGSNCLVQTAKSIEHFYSDKGMDLATLGPFTVEKLLQNEKLFKLLKTSPWALLDPIAFNIYPEILSILGEKRSGNYAKALEAINEKKNEAHFIAALGLPGLAYKTAVKICNYMTNGKVEQSIAQKALINYAKAKKSLTKALEELKFFHLANMPVPAHVKFCITGSLTSSRNDFISYLETKGWQYQNQVSRHTDYLILGDSPGRVKIQKAKELSIIIIMEEDLPNHIKEKE